ncbi:MAG: hypothetical protein ACOZIN_07410 [Myxococcota bacterium]
MKKWLPALLLAAACSSRTEAPSAELFGTQDLALVGRLLFVTSTDRNELRVLDVEGQPVGFLRAPNPLQALSVPVLERPVSLARDVRYDGGQLVAGPLVYVASQGTSAISVVKGLPSTSLEEDPQALVELFRLSTAHPVTAMAAQGGDQSTLYFATFDGTSSTVWELSDVPRAVVSPEGVAALQGRIRQLAFLPDEAVVGLLALPTPRLVVASRSQGGRAGHTVVLDTLTLATLPLAFPAPVRNLVSDPSGSRVFGTLDPEACGDLSCRGVMGVDATSGQVLVDGAGLPMLPVQFGSALLRGLDVASGLNLPGVGDALAGAFTASSGEVVFFDAQALRHIDTDAQPAALVSTQYVAADGSALPFVAGPVLADPNSFVADGAARDETLSLVFEGALPGLVDVPTSGNDDRFVADPAFLARAQMGDYVEVFDDGGRCAEVMVAAIEPAALVASAVPACANRTRFTVRAAGSQPYVVSGSVSGFMGRAGSDSTFVFQGSYFQRPADFSPSRPQLSLRLGPGDPNIRRDFRYLVQSEDSFAPLAVSIGNPPCGVCTLPNSVVLEPQGDQAFVTYPSGNVVAEIETPGVQRGVNAGNVQPHR